MIRSTVHADLDSLRSALHPHAVCFAAGIAAPAADGLPSSLTERLHLHRHAGAAALVVDGLEAADLVSVRTLGRLGAAATAVVR